MQYPEDFVRPMREELTRLGVEELRTADAVDAAIRNSTGTLMVVVNSICGCAAGKARPGVALALQSEVRPDRVVTVFAGADIEATERARSYFTGYPPSSPSIGIFKDGQLRYMMERYQIEGKGPEAIAQELTKALSGVRQGPDAQLAGSLTALSLLASLCAGILVGDRAAAQTTQASSRMANRSAGNPNYPELSRYATDLTEQASSGLLQPVIGRDAEINRALEILS